MSTGHTSRRAAFLAALLFALGPGSARPAPAATAAVTLPAAREIRLPNGAVLLLSERRELPVISFFASLRGGSIADPPGREGVAELTAELLRKGAGKRTARQIADAAEGAGADLSTGAALESSYITGRFLARDQALMLSLLADLLRAPTFPADEFEKARARTIEAILAAKDDPGSILAEFAPPFFYGAHPYGRPGDGDESTVRSITREDVLAYHRANYGADRLTLSVVGDFDPRAMEGKLRAALGGWRKAAEPVRAAPPTERRSGRRVLLVDKPDATQSYFWIGNRGISRTDPDRVAVDIANTAFGGRFTSMLNSALRIESGLSYAARCRVPRPREPGTVAISSYTKTESTAKAIDLALSVLAKLRRENLSAPLLASVKAYIAGQFAPDYETSGAVAGALVDLASHGLPRDEIEGYLGRVAATDSAAVARAIARVYPPVEDLTFVFVGNAAQLRTVVRKYGPVTEVSATTPVLEALRGK